MTDTGRTDREQLLDDLDTVCRTMMLEPAESESSRDFVFIADDDGRVQFLSATVAEALGSSLEGPIGRPVEELFEPGGWELQRLSVSEVVRSGQPMSFEGKATLAGRELVLSTTLEPILSESGEVRAALGIAREITRRQGDSAGCGTTRVELSAVFRDAPVLMLLLDPDGTVRQMNRAAARFARRRPRGAQASRVGDSMRCLHALDNPAGGGHGLFCKTCPLRIAVQSTLKTGKSHHRVEARLPVRRRDLEGESCFLVTTLPLQAAGGPTVLLCLEDITERRRAERALEESQRTLSTLMRNLPGMAYRCCNDEHWTMELVSEGCLELTGYHANELLLNHVTSYEQIIRPEDRAAVRRAVEEALSRGEPFELVYRITTADGQEKWVWEKGMGVYSPQGHLTALEGFITDITARKRAEEEKESMQALLLQAQKMEAIGVLAGGVAHDFNNLLTIIHGNTELAMMAADEPLQDQLRKVLAAAEHGASLVRQLLVFSRKHPMVETSLDLNRIVGDLLKMLARLIGEDIAIETDLADGLWTVRGDETNLEQVIMNLTVNARDAMPDGGRLTIATANVTLDASVSIRTPEARPGRFVRATVADTGIGMDEGTLLRIFEPFFSTKEAARGTGLGLAVVYGIVRQHGGWITAASQPGEGAIFRIYLPASDRDPRQETPKAELLEELQGAGQRILLVEDEKAVREFAKLALSNNGYVVLDAADADQADEIVAREDRQFDLVLSDVVLPGRSGVQLVDRLLDTKPELRVLLTSGHMDRRSQWPVIRERGFPFLQKPYSLIALLQATRAALAVAP